MDERLKQLVQRVKNNEPDAYDEAVKEYELMIYSIISKYSLEYGDYRVSKEDLFQEGCIGLIDALKAYKETPKTQLVTFVYVVVERRIQKEFFKLMKPYKQEYSFDKYEFVDRFDNIKAEAVSDNPIKYVAYIEAREQLQNLKYATDLDKEIIRLRVENYSYKEIAKKLNVTTKKVDNRIARLKRCYAKDKKE